MSKAPSAAGHASQGRSIIERIVKLNVVERLTLYTIVPVLISGIYGMNIPLPFQNKRWTFWAYVTVCVLWVVGVTAFLRGAHAASRAGPLR